MLLYKKRKIKEVNPDLYIQCLSWIEQRDGLRPSELRPAQVAEILSVEEELGASMPGEYQQHLLRVGSGQEHGGLAIWFHLDRTLSGNIFHNNEIIRRSNGRAGAPKEFLAIYDSLDGELFGFCLDGDQFSKTVYCWEEDSGVLSEAEEDLFAFYLSCLDCSEEEIEAIASGEIEVVR